MQWTPYPDIRVGLGSPSRFVRLKHYMPNRGHFYAHIGSDHLIALARVSLARSALPLYRWSLLTLHFWAPFR